MPRLLRHVQVNSTHASISTSYCTKLSELEIFHVVMTTELVNKQLTAAWETTLLSNIPCLLACHRQFKMLSLMAFEISLWYLSTFFTRLIKLVNYWINTLTFNTFKSIFNLKSTYNFIAFLLSRRFLHMIYFYNFSFTYRSLQVK